MKHTQRYYDEIRESKALHKKECIDDHNAEKDAYRKIFNEVHKEEMARR